MAHKKSVSEQRAVDSARIESSEIAGETQGSKPVAEPVASAEANNITGLTELTISSIRLDGGTQSRAAMSRPTIAEYAEAMASGAAFPPVVVFRDSKGVHWLADGFHRVHAALKNGQEAIKVELREGSQRDAILFALKANATHGLRRTSADKRHAVDLLLRDSKWSTRTDRWIAEACGVGHQLVGTRRAQLGESSSSEPRVGKDGKARKLPKAKAQKTNFADTITLAMAPADENSALADLESDIERHMRGWAWTPERFTTTLETWAQMARDHFAANTTAVAS